LRQMTRKNADKKVKIPLGFEDTLKAFLSTPPPKRKKKAAKKKAK
jgi:hypothetical protein